MRLQGHSESEIETIPLFPLPETNALRPARTLAQAEKDAKASWASYSGKRVACDECVVFLHENGGRGPLPRSARRVRTVRDTGEQLRLCMEHAGPREIAAGNAKKKSAARRTTRKA